MTMASDLAIVSRALPEQDRIYHAQAPQNAS